MSNDVMEDDKESFDFIDMPDIATKLIPLCFVFSGPSCFERPPFFEHPCFVKPLYIELKILPFV